MAGILVLVIGSMRQNVDLVSDDYYEQEVKYQDRIEKIQNRNAQKKDIKVTAISNDAVEVKIDVADSSSLTGNVHFFRPSDASLDFIIEGIQPSMVIQHPQLKKGFWRVKVEWDADGSSYYDEVSITL